MEQIRKDPEFVASQESMKPKSTGEKVNGFLSNFPPQSMIRYGQMGSKASGIELNPSSNGDPTIGFAISDPKTQKTTKYSYPANKEVIQEVLRLTWRNPAIMAIAIALIWLIPQLLIRRILYENYEKKKLEMQKDKIGKLYPKTLK